MTNHWIDIEGDAAVGESYVIAYQQIAGEEPQDVMTGGRYIDRYERRDGANGKSVIAPLSWIGRRPAPPRI